MQSAHRASIITIALLVASGCERDTEPEPNPIRFILNVAEGSQAIWIDVMGASSENGSWSQIIHDDSDLFRSSAFCHCDVCDAQGACPMADMIPYVEEVVPGGSYSTEWNGLVPGPTRQCESGSEACYLWESAPTGPYTARFCYGLGVEGTPPSDATLVDETCEDVVFEVPDEDGVVELVVD